MTQLSKDDQQKIEGFKHLANELLQQEQWQDAIKVIGLLIKMEPLTERYYNLGAVQLKVHRYDDAVESF